MEAISASEDDSSETSQSSGQKPLKPKRRSLVERELETNMTAKATSPLSFLEPGLNTSRYGRARKIKTDTEFCDTNKSVSDYLKSSESELTTNIIKSSPKPTHSTRNSSPKGISPMTKAENLIEKIHSENLSLSRFGSKTKPSPVKPDKTYVRKDLIQKKDIDDPSVMLKNMFSPSKSPYKPSKSSHLNVFLERSSADKSGIEMETVSNAELFDTPDVKATKKSRKIVRKSDSAITETKKISDTASTTKSSSTKKSKRHTINAVDADVVKTLDFNAKKKKALPLNKQPENDSKTEQPITEKLPNKQLGGSSKKKKPKISPSIPMETPEPQGLLIEKTSVVKTLDFDIKKKPSALKITKTEDVKNIEPVIVPVENPLLEYTIIQGGYATNGLYEMELECSYSVGDLAWSRVGTYPFWPCIVTREPFTELFVKKKLFGRVEREIIHVTFFADNGRRGWIVDNMLRQYHGIEEFLSARDGFTAEDKKKDPKLYAAYFISDKKREIWNQAVSEAENLFKEPKLIRTDILYEMLSKNKNVKILKRPKEIIKTVKIETPENLAPDLKKLKPVKLHRTDSDVSLSESLYDSLFSDDDSKAVDPDKSRNKSFDVSDVVTACLDNMAVKTGMAKIQMQSHMDRWLQKAKSLTPEKIQKVLTPNKDRKDRSSRRNKKTPVKTVKDKPYPLRKFSKESPDDGVLNSYQTEHDYTKCDIENENPGDYNNLNGDISESPEEVHYIESGTGIGTILAIESLSDKVSDSQETLNNTDIMDISTASDVKMELSKTCDNAPNEITNSNGEAMETDTKNTEIEENYLISINLPLTDTDTTPKTELPIILSNNPDPSHTVVNEDPNSITNSAAVLMDVDQETPIIIANDSDMHLFKKEDINELQSSEEINKERKEISVSNSNVTGSSVVVNDEITDQNFLDRDQTDGNLKPTEVNGNITTNSVTYESTENIVSEVNHELEISKTNPKQNQKTDDIDKIVIYLKDNTESNKIADSTEELKVFNSKIEQSHHGIVYNLKDDDSSNKATVKKDLENSLEAKITKTIKTEKKNLEIRKRLRLKTKRPITTQAESQVKESTNDPETINASKVSLDLPENTNCTNVNEGLNASNSDIIVQNHEAIDNEPKNYALSTEAVVKEVLQNSFETSSTEINKIERKAVATRKSLRIKTEPAAAREEQQINSADPENLKNNETVLNFPANIDGRDITNDEINMTNTNVMQNHESNDRILKNDELSSEVNVKNYLKNTLEANNVETIDKTEIRSATRKSLRLKYEQPITQQVEESNTDPKTMKSRKIKEEKNLPDNSDCVPTTIANGEIIVSNSNIVQKHEEFHSKLNNIDISIEAVVKNNFQNNQAETINKTEKKPSATRISLRAKPEPQSGKVEHPVNETYSIEPETINFSNNELKTENTAKNPENTEKWTENTEKWTENTNCYKITDEKINVPNHEGIDIKVKNNDLSTSAVVNDSQNSFASNTYKTNEKTKGKTFLTLRRFRPKPKNKDVAADAKPEPEIEKQAIQMNKNSILESESIKSSKIELGLADKPEHNVESIIKNEVNDKSVVKTVQVMDQMESIEPEIMKNNEIELNIPESAQSLSDIIEKNNQSINHSKVKNEEGKKRNSGRLSSINKLKQIPKVTIVKLNICHMGITVNKSRDLPKEVDNNINVNNIEESHKAVVKTKKEKQNNINKTKTAKPELIEKTIETKQILENGSSENNDQPTTNNQHANTNGTSDMNTKKILDLEDCKTIPEKKLTEDISKIEKQNVRKSGRIDRKRSSKKSTDWQKEVEEAKRILLQDTDTDQDMEADTGTNNITDERDTKKSLFEKEINLITSVSEVTSNPKEQEVHRNVSNNFHVKDEVPNKANVNQKVFSNFRDQRLTLVTPLEETEPDSSKISIKSLINDNNEKDVFNSENVEVTSEDAKSILSNIFDVNLNGKKHIDLTSLKINKLETYSNTSNKIQEIHEKEENIIRMTEDLDVTPEKIINADVIIENGHTDESDSDLDVKIEAISLISSIDTPLLRKRGRPRKSNNLVIDNVVIEEISLTDDKLTVIEDIKPRKRGRPKKYNLPEPDKVLTNGYHGDTDSLPEFAHLMDLDVSLDGAYFNQAVKVENIALLTDVEVLAKVTEANLNNCSMVVDDCQDISLDESVQIAKQNCIPKEINENGNNVIVDIKAQNLKISELPPDDAVIIEQVKKILDNDKPINSKAETIELSIKETKNNHQKIESISSSSTSIKSEIESCPQSENDEKQTNEAHEKTIKHYVAKVEQDLEATKEEKDQEFQDGTSKRKQRVKPENKLNNDVYKALDDPEFAKYLEMRQDALIDENPHVSQEDIVKYLYKTWIYEQSLKPDAVKSDDLIESNLVKGLENNTASQPKKIKKRVKLQVDKEEKYDLNEVIIPRNRPKRRTNALYITADDTDIEDELEAFEILNKNKPKEKTLKSAQNDSQKVMPTEIKTDSELDDIPLANLIVDKDKPTITEDLTKQEAEEIIEKPFDQVEYYFSQLTQPKPNVFKGLVRERVCDICFKTSNLVKCRGPCNGMFHIDCVKEETTQVAIQNSWSRGRKKKKPRGPRPKNRSQDDSQSDDKDLNLEDITDSTLALEIDAENFELQLAEKMKDLLEKEKVIDLASSDEELQWDDADPGKCEIVNITLKTKRNLSNNTDVDFKCNDCLKLSIPKCYVCKSEKSPKNSVELRQRCQIAQCHKYYHLDCLDFWPQTQFNQGESARKTADLFDILSCPRHVCHSCVCDDPRGCNTRFSGEKLARCVKCPATYHSFTKCLPAGSQILSASHIICPRHTVNRPGKVPCHVNTGWCFICALGGSLICCEYCPTSFHADCLNIAPPEGNYMCEDCETGRLPLYGEMVWVKLGHYRWWPGLVLHPCEIPDNIKCMRHAPGEFVVRFFGQYDHYWVNRGRVFPFQEGDSGRISSQKSKIDEAFTLAIEHAQRAFQILKTAPPNEEEEAEIALSFLPPQYVKLRVNKPCGSVQIGRPDDEVNGLSQCDCDPRAERPCDPNTQCLNRMLLTECGPACRASDRCQNRAFEKRHYPKMAPYRTPHRGWGLRTLEEVKAGQFVIEYVGELIDEAEFKRRMQLKHEIRDENYYFLTLDKERMIDAGPKGNLARFMNHSCEPNCETQKWTVLGDVRVGLFALHDIPAFTEVTFNYNLECAGIDKKRCMCGAARCSGYIGAKPKTLEEINPKKNIQIKKRIYKKRKKEESPSTIKIKIPKPRTTTRSKPKELTEIEKDLLIIKSATIGLLSSDSESSLKINLDDKVRKRKRSSSVVSSDDFLSNSDVLEPSGKVLLLESESPSSEGNI